MVHKFVLILAVSCFAHDESKCDPFPFGTNIFNVVLAAVVSTCPWLVRPFYATTTYFSYYINGYDFFLYRCRSDHCCQILAHASFRALLKVFKSIFNFSIQQGSFSVFFSSVENVKNLMYFSGDEFYYQLNISDTISTQENIQSDDLKFLIHGYTDRVQFNKSGDEKQ